MNKKELWPSYAGVFSAVSVNPGCSMADSDTETDNRNRGNVLCGRRQHRWADDRFRGRHPQKTVKASEMGMSSEETLDFPLWDSLQSFR